MLHFKKNKIDKKQLNIKSEYWQSCQYLFTLFVACDPIIQLVNRDSDRDRDCRNFDCLLCWFIRSTDWGHVWNGQGLPSCFSLLRVVVVFVLVRVGVHQKVHQLQTLRKENESCWWIVWSEYIKVEFNNCARHIWYFYPVPARALNNGNRRGKFAIGSLSVDRRLATLTTSIPSSIHNKIQLAIIAVYLSRSLSHLHSAEMECHFVLEFEI